MFGFFRCVGRAIFPDTLCSFKLLLRDDLEFGHQFGAGISAAENAHVGQVADHSSQAARMPALSRAGTVTSIVQIGGDPLCAVTLVYIFIEDQPNDFGFLLVDMQFIEFVLALFDAAMNLVFDVVIDSGSEKRTYSLNRSYYGLYIPAGLWRQMKNFSTNSLAMVITSTTFSEIDDIRNYDEFLKYNAR